MIESNKVIEQEREKWNEREKEMLSELTRKDEENIALAEKIKEMETFNKNLQGKLSKEIEEYDKQLMVGYILFEMNFFCGEFF